MQQKLEGERRRWTLASVLQSDFSEELKNVRMLFPEAEKKIGGR
jgi:hypothetical protein